MDFPEFPGFASASGTSMERLEAFSGQSLYRNPALLSILNSSGRIIDWKTRTRERLPLNWTQNPTFSKMWTNPYRESHTDFRCFFNDFHSEAFRNVAKQLQNLCIIDKNNYQISRTLRILQKCDTISIKLKNHRKSEKVGFWKSQFSTIPEPTVVAPASHGSHLK